MATDPTAPFSFIRADVNKQRELARKIVADVEEVDAVLVKLGNVEGAQEAVSVLKERRNSLLLVAEELGSNATSTSSTATSVISYVTAKST